jgi:hypothetical protein
MANDRRMARRAVALALGRCPGCGAFLALALVADVEAEAEAAELGTELTENRRHRWADLEAEALLREAEGRGE